MGDYNTIPQFNIILTNKSCIFMSGKQGSIYVCKCFKIEPKGNLTFVT